MSWNQGYITDIQYTHGFYREMTPSILEFVRLVRGHRSPAASARKTYCELGCGQGFSVNLLAAANPEMDFYANDFNPGQIAGAQRLAAEGGTKNVHFYERSFADFGADPTLPATFDYIALHGIYSWVSAENRDLIVTFIRERLAPGGLVYLSYNALPGWAAAAPLHRIMYDQSQRSRGSMEAKIEQALDFVTQLEALGAISVASNPSLTSRFGKLKTAPKGYVAHEFFNEHWEPQYFADVAEHLGQAKLQFVGSAHLPELVDGIDLTPDMTSLLSAESDPVAKQSLRDLLVNQEFRRDVFSKGSEPHTLLSCAEAWRDARFALSTHRSSVPLKAKGRRGEVDLLAEVYGPILDQLAHGPRTGGEIMANPALAAIGRERLQEALLVLCGTNHVQPCLPVKTDKQRARSVQNFNKAVLSAAESRADLTALASPVTGGGVNADRFTQLFLSAAQQGRSDAEEWIWALLDAQNQRLVKDEKPLQTKAENVKELAERHEKFTAERLPIFRQLGLI